MIDERSIEAMANAISARPFDLARCVDNFFIRYSFAYDKANIADSTSEPRYSLEISEGGNNRYD